MRLLVVACALLTLPLFGASVTVGCPGGTPGDFSSINAAVASLDLDGPHTITVSGTCTENVLLNQRERLTIQGPATIIGPAIAITIRDGNVVLRNLVVRGTFTGIQVADNGALTLSGATVENAANFALDVFGNASAVIGGMNAADAVVLRNSGGGMRCESCVAFFPGWVTIENNTGNAGLVIEGGRVETFGQRPASSIGPVQGGPTIIRNNFNGVAVANRGIFETGRVNFIQNNAASGILATDGTVRLAGSTLPDGTPMGTIVENNARNGVTALFNATFSASGPNTIRNNGSAADELRAGVSATHSSVVTITGGEITGSVGPGISADSISSVRLNGVSISGNSEGAVRLRHGSLLDSVGGNTIPAPSVTCDGTSIVHGNFTGVAAFECEKATKK